MKTTSDLENYLMTSEFAYERLGESMWVISGDSGPLSHVVLWLDEDVVGFRLKVVDLPSEPAPKLLHKLLELNASDLVHCAYGIEEQAVVLVASTLMSTFDRAEFQAILDAFAVAVSTHHGLLSELLKA
jgi:hypothetical protein